MNFANYLLIDGVLRPDAIKQLYQRSEPLSIKPLYVGTRWAALKERGPILVGAESPCQLIHDWRTSPAQHLDACALYSQAPTQTVADHLRQFLSPPDHLGQCSLLRFADPVVLHYWLSSYSPEHLTQVLGPVEQIWVRQPVHSWHPLPQTPFTSFVRYGPVHAWEARFSLLGEPQIEAFEQAYWWVFKERLHRWLTSLKAEAFEDKTGTQIDNWMEHAIESGRRWGLVSEYAFATWAELCLLWGLDFTDLEDGPYQRWKSTHPEQARLAPELRLEALDNFRLNAAKEASHE